MEQNLRFEQTLGQLVCNNVGTMEETLVYMFSTYSKFEVSHQITEGQAFVLFFATPE